MKVAFFDTSLLWTPHFETDLELMEEHLLKGDEVIWFDCNGELPFCQPNPYHKKNICRSCIKRKNKGINLLSGKIQLVKIGPILSAPVRNDLLSIQKLKKIKIDNAPLGLGCSSSLVSVLKDPNPDLRRYKTLYQNICDSSFSIFHNSLSLFQSVKIQRIYLFNGRFANERALLESAKISGIDCYIHERGCDINHYMLYKNTLPHNRKQFIKNMESLWTDPTVPLQSKIETGKAFFEERARGKEQFWISFVKDQKKDLLPENWDPEKINITIFTSSEDELVSISDEWDNPVYKSQYEGIKNILEDSPSSFVFYLRIHPNLIGVKNEYLDKIYKLSYPNLFIIPPKSKINSYALIKHSHKIVVFGSTVGAEATYWHTPSILAGVSYYKGINVTYDAENHADVIRLLKNNLKPKPLEPALKYGYYLKTFGTKYKYYKAHNLYFGKFKNKYVYGNFLFYSAMRILSLFNLLGFMKRKKKKLSLLLK